MTTAKKDLVHLYPFDNLWRTAMHPALPGTVGHDGHGEEEEVDEEEGDQDIQQED